LFLSGSQIAMEESSIRLVKSGLRSSAIARKKSEK
jgi:hypothetical protein